MHTKINMTFERNSISRKNILRLSTIYNEEEGIDVVNMGYRISVIFFSVLQLLKQWSTLRRVIVSQVIIITIKSIY